MNDFKQTFPFRRLKCDVLTELPQKKEEILRIKMVEIQETAYKKLVSEYKQRAKEVRKLHLIYCCRAF